MLKPIIKEDGVTPRERYLAKLSEESFFGLWSYPNVYTDEGYSKNKVGKELCDLLVVVGDTAIIFSDKDIKFNAGKEINVAWKRWFKKSVVKSAGQLFGAESWLRNRSGRTFLDKECKNEFPIDLAEVKKIHLVAVTCNTADGVLNYYGGTSQSLLQQYYLNEKQCMETPFCIGDLYPEKSFVHVLDEFTLDLLMSHLDTITDFIHYLETKANAIRTGMLMMATGEEEILSVYLQNRVFGSLVGKILHPTGNIERDGGMSLVEGLWDEYISDELYIFSQSLYKQYDIFDRLIERFSEHILAARVGLGQDLPFSTHERAVRHLAQEPRVARAVLSQGFMDKFDEVPKNKRSSRVAISPSDPQKAYIFLFIPRDEGQTDEEYREQRLKYNEAYAFVAKYKHPNVVKFVVISTEPKGTESRSEDIYSVEYLEEFNKEHIQQAKELQKNERILNDTWALRSNLVTGVHRNKGQKRNMIPKYRRNDPCPCGSGKKFKKCCINSI
ncbi:SEC-C domain-containing protein [Vibrio parahaemolyticus]|nr:hypothetical protein [Vibrio parahaemolyticus]